MAKQTKTEETSTLETVAKAVEPISTEQATEALVREREIRVRTCAQEVNEVLNRYNCRIDVAIVLRENSVTPTANVVSK